MSKAAAIVSALLAIAYAVIRPSPSPAPLPNDAHALAQRVASHPADWQAASALAERALDAPSPERLALWRAAGSLAISLAPYRPEPRTSFARAAFFHWGELAPPDRQGALDAYAPMMRDWGRFMVMKETLYALTGNFDYLRRAHPPTPEGRAAVAALAAMYGDVENYRAMRAEIQQQDAGTPRPAPPAERDRWSGLCGENVCNSAVREVEAAHAVAVTVTPVVTDDVRPYVEVYVDGALRAEGAIEGEQTLTAPVDAPGAHRVEVRLVNPVTRNDTPRRIRITALQSL